MCYDGILLLIEVTMVSKKGLNVVTEQSLRVKEKTMEKSSFDNCYIRKVQMFQKYPKGYLTCPGCYKERL